MRSTNTSVGLCICLFYVTSLSGCALWWSIFPPQQAHITGVTAYVPFQGDPTEVSDLNLYGPGSINTVPGFNQQLAHDYHARYIIGGTTVTNLATDVAFVVNGETGTHPTYVPTPVMVSSFSGTSSSSLTLDGSTPATASAYSLTGSFNVSGTTTVNAQPGQIYAIQPLTQEGLINKIKQKWSSLDPTIKASLINGKVGVVSQAYFSTGISFTYTNSINGILSLTGNLPSVVQASLTAQGYVLSDKKLIYNKPVFIGYTLLDRSLLPKQ